MDAGIIVIIISDNIRDQRQSCDNIITVVRMFPSASQKRDTKDKHAENKAEKSGRAQESEYANREHGVPETRK